MYNIILFATKPERIKVYYKTAFSVAPLPPSVVAPLVR
jgi:hypothetical protein